MLTNSVGLNTPNPKYYALHNKYDIKCELGKLQLTQYNQHTTDGELSITEHCHMQTRHSFLVYILLHSTAVAVECSYNNNIMIIPRHCL